MFGFVWKQSVLRPYFSAFQSSVQRSNIQKYKAITCQPWCQWSAPCLRRVTVGPTSITVSTWTSSGRTSNAINNTDERKDLSLQTISCCLHQLDQLQWHYVHYITYIIQWQQLSIRGPAAFISKSLSLLLLLSIVALTSGSTVTL